ncbi:related to Cytochrome P450 4F8 [Melanopsichium pennsylvanicum]|uniref:Related to Cytochrome P450 4F8 n=2 Tax=Melanopsichium pennsylvanicum TaxID=63383 RepID=A0AAJ4XIS0_9BASI|nr:related to Cytochrome P450 4F8 [Melanopsichium pennsylvanicum 4]SNX82878.1 related to Cytochrome P450 4F8 [Melanopsichium pennsylvanicum]
MIAFSASSPTLREQPVEALLQLLQIRPFASAFTLLFIYVTYKLAIKPILVPSPYRNLPRPLNPSYILGARVVEAKGLQYTPPSLSTPITISGPGEVVKHYSSTLQSSVFVFPEPFGGETLHLADPYALNFVLSDIDKFQSDELRSSLIEFIVGNGIVTRYGDAHRRQRRLMSPAFTPAHIKDLTPVFCKYADLMSCKISEHLEVGDDGEKTIDWAEYLDCTMLDIIGMAGFNYPCMALEKGRAGSELSSAFNGVNQAAIDFGLGRAIHLGLSAMLYPRAGTWPLSEANRRIQKVNTVMERITMGIVKDAKANVLRQGEDIEGKKDLLSLLIKSNLGAEKGERMTDKEIGGQIQTFMFAGYETSAVTTSWALYFLSRNHDVQDKLRKIVSDVVKERRGLSLEDVKAADLDYDDVWCEEFKYLDWILAETLRLCPPVPGNDREAMQDTVLPLMTPVKLTTGESVDKLFVKKGSRLTIGIKTVNYDKRLYGQDADEFRPERWGELPQMHGDAKIPPYGMYSFVGGPKSCIGAKFAQTEMKVLLITVMAKFHLSPVPGVTIKQHQALIVRPRVETESGQSGAGMPLRVRRL